MDRSFSFTYVLDFALVLMRCQQLCTDNINKIKEMAQVRTAWKGHKEIHQMIH